MTDPTQRPMLPNKHLNRGLFSDHYLDEIVPASGEWNSEQFFAQVMRIREGLLERLDGLRPEELDEAQLEDRWIKPVLEALGHHWSVQVKIRYRDRGFRKPDYAFADTPEAAGKLRNEIYTPDMLQDVIAIGDAKKWGARLDQSGGRDERNPSQQIDEYLRYSEVKWGILTDGRYWRLYERATSKDNTFYAVDLESLLRYGAVEDFYYFYLFFRREAFAAEGWLDHTLSGSLDYAESLSDQLEDEVYNALELIAQGFLNFRRNRLKPEPEALTLIYEQSLVFLYRLLFIFYAESRDILPMSDNQAYAEGQSLSAIKKEIANEIDYYPGRLGRRVDDDAMYARLSTLFFNIDQGSGEFGITAYNGRLFSDDEHPFLAEKRVGGAYLAYAIDRLARVPDRGDRTGRKRVFVDYRDLDVRHLGAIYEHLLDYQLDVAAEPLTVRRRNNHEVYEVAGPGDEVVKEPGDVLLRTGNNERKITGSYYTPDYIVSFIVENTLEPLLAEITTRYAHLDDQGQWMVRDPQGLRKAVLSLNVLDPATGSGHFMVEAVNFIAKWLTGLNLLPPDIERNEEELTYWKRQVVAACIYGVDVNPLAVELARLSLWLATISRDRPLSFLDHHVRLGNTLVGARLDALTPRPPLPNAPSSPGEGELRGEAQLSLWDNPSFGETVRDAVGRINSIEQTIADVVGDVKEQAQSYEAMFHALEPWRNLAHIWTARHFGLSVTAEQWQELYTAITSDQSLSSDLQTLLDEALALHEQYHFFHWELAFPEVFFDESGQPIPGGGFDAVVGNPPYVRWQSLEAILKNYFSAVFEIYHSSADLFIYFFEAGLKLLKRDRRLGFITTGSFKDSSSAGNFRELVAQRYAIEAIVDFGPMQPFRGVDFATNVVISILRTGDMAESFRSLVLEKRELEMPLSQLFAYQSSNTLSASLAQAEWRFQPAKLTALFEKIMANGIPLSEYVNESIYYGILTGRNEAFYIGQSTRESLIREHPSSAEIIIDFVRGENLRPWYQSKNEEYLISARQGIDIDMYPAIKRHLSQFREILEPRPPGHRGSWRGRTSGNYKWYEWHDTVAYYQKFAEKKIMAPDIGKFPRFSWDETGLYCNDKGYIVLSETKSLLSILNSRLTWFALSQIATPLAMRAGLWRYQSKIQFIRRLPIPPLTASQEGQLAEVAEQITGLARRRYQLHEAFRHRVQMDLGSGGRLNTRLTEWYDLPDFSAFREQVAASFGRGHDVPVRERGDWEAYLRDEQANHAALTAQIITLETRLNAVVYAAFDLDADEIALIEQATKYPYGAV